jgi:hypothetical protein
MPAIFLEEVKRTDRTEEEKEVKVKRAEEK